MKILLTVIIMFFCASVLAQKDSLTCVPNAQLRQAIKINEKFKLLSQIDSANWAYINTLTLSLNNRNTTIFKMGQTIDQQNQIIASEKTIIGGSDTKYNIEASLVGTLQKDLNKQIAKTWIVGGIGVAVSASLFILLVKK